MLVEELELFASVWGEILGKQLNKPYLWQNKVTGVIEYPLKLLANITIYNLSFCISTYEETHITRKNSLII